MDLRRWFITTCTLILLASSAGAVDQLHAPAKARCPVCGMFVAKYPDWLSSIEFKDSTSVMFDGVKDMLKYYFNIQKYQKNLTQADIKSIWVTDYYSLLATNGEEAWYVTGSDVYGPMGNEFIPFADQSDAAQFLKDHKGKVIIHFNDISSEIIKEIDQHP